MTIRQLTFNPFQENTFVIYDETKECVIIDPGMYTREEQKQFEEFITDNELKPVKLVSTHSHLDHVFGNAFVARTYHLEPMTHKEDVQTLQMFKRTVEMYQIPNTEEPPAPTAFYDEGDKIEFGNSHLDILFVPGHCPGHVAFVNHELKWIVNGDCLFYGSIGRTDLPGGNHEQLIQSIKTKLFSLDDSYQVYCGHGPATTIGFEKMNNPFLR